MDYKLLASNLIIILCIVTIVFNSLDFKPLRFRCKNYILNSYVYLVLTIAIFMSILFTMNNIDISQKTFLGIFIVAVFIMLVLTIYLLSLSAKKHFLMKHILWLLWVICISYISYPMFKEYNSIFYVAFLYVTLIMFFLTAIVFINPEIVKEHSWGMSLFIFLLILIIFELLERYLRYKGYLKDKKYNKMLVYVGIILFSGFVLYDTKVIIVNSKKCGHLVDPDYINESIGVFLDFINLLSRVIRIMDE